MCLTEKSRVGDSIRSRNFPDLTYICMVIGTGLLVLNQGFFSTVWQSGKTLCRPAQVPIMVLKRKKFAGNSRKTYIEF